MKRVTFRGVGVFANGKQLNRVTAFGASGTFSREEIFEMGHGDRIAVADDIDEVSMTIDTNEYGSIATHLALADKVPSATTVNFSTDFEFAQTAIWNYAMGRADGGEKMHAELMQNAVLTGYNLNYSVDGNATESFTLSSDNKTWLPNVEGHLIVPLIYDNGNLWSNEVPSGLADSVTAVIVDGVHYEVGQFTDNTNDDQVMVTIPGTSADNTVHALVKMSTGGMKFIPDTSSDAVKRRGHIELYLVKNYTNDGGLITGGQEFKIEKAQTVSVDATLNRENIPQLGNFHYYYRPLVIPIEVGVNFDVIFGDLELWSQFVGAEAGQAAYSMSQFRNDLGLIIRVYNVRDIDVAKGRKVVKEIHIPHLIPADESWNVSLDGQATQSFSFRSSELAMKKVN